MRLLIVNPNMTQAVTDALLEEARRCCRAETEVSAETATFGVSIVSTEAENAIAIHAALDLLATHHEGFDAAIVGMSFDAGVVAARTMLPIPVIGLTEAALHTACLLGRRFGLVVLGRVSLPLYAELLDRLGLASRVGCIKVVDVASAAAYLDRPSMDGRVEEAAVALATKASVDVIVVCGAAVAGVARRIGSRIPVPLLDGIAPAVGQAELLAGLGLDLRRVDRRLARADATSGLSPALTALFTDHA